MGFLFENRTSLSLVKSHGQYTVHIHNIYSFTCIHYTWSVPCQDSHSFCDTYLHNIYNFTRIDDNSIFVKASCQARFCTTASRPIDRCAFPWCWVLSGWAPGLIVTYSRHKFLSTAIPPPGGEERSYMSMCVKHAALTAKAGPYFLTTSPLTAFITTVIHSSSASSVFRAVVICCALFMWMPTYHLFCWALGPVLS